MTLDDVHYALGAEDVVLVLIISRNDVTENHLTRHNSSSIALVLIEHTILDSC